MAATKLDRALLKAELQRDGLWNKYWPLRDRLKKQGYTYIQACELALKMVREGGGAGSSVDDGAAAAPPDCGESGSVEEPALRETKPKGKRGGKRVKGDGVSHLKKTLEEMGSDCKIDPMKDVWWIYNNLAVPPEDVDPKTAPSPGAYKWLLTMQQLGNEQMLAQFYERVLTRLFPPQKLLENYEKMYDDGGPVVKAIEACQRARGVDGGVREAGSEGR